MVSVIPTQQWTRIVEDEGDELNVFLNFAPDKNGIAPGIDVEAYNTSFAGGSIVIAPGADGWSGWEREFDQSSRDSVLRHAGAILAGLLSEQYSLEVMRFGGFTRTTVAIEVDGFGQAIFRKWMPPWRRH